MSKIEFKNEIVLRFPTISYELKREDVIKKLMMGPIQLASPDLVQSLTSRDQKAKIGLDKYINRSQHRSTPYGLFAGIGVLKWGSYSGLKFKKNEIYSKTRLDASVLDQLLIRIIDVPFALESMSFNINQTIIKNVDGYSYLEKSYINTKIKYNLSNIESDEHIDLVLSSFSKHQMSYEELSFLFIRQGYSKQEIKEYLRSLVLSNILIPTIYPSSLTFDNFRPILNFVRELNQRQNQTEYSDLVDNILDLKLIMDDLDSSNVKNLLYRKFDSKLSDLGIDFRKNQMVHTDTFGAFNGFVNKKNKNKISQCITILNNYHNRIEDLEKFKQNFSQKYQDGQAVPILDIIFSKNGLGYSGTASKNNSFLQDIIPLRHEESNRIKLNDFQLELNHLVKIGSFEIDAGDVLKKHKRNSHPLLNGIYQSTMLQLLENDMIFLKDIQGVGADFISRFAYGSSKIKVLYQEMLNDLADNNKKFIFAELDFIPESRVQNISSRNNSFNYKISICTPDTDEKKSIQLNDLLVVVQYDKVLLFSQSLDKFVIPLFTNAYNILRDQSLLFTFLENVGKQFFPQGSVFSWGDLTLLHNFLPRVTIAGCVVKEAQWNFKDERLHKLKKDLKQGHFKPKEYDLPEKVKYQNGDNFLIINLNNASSQYLLFTEIKNKSFIHLKEYIQPKKNFIADELGNNYSHEMLVFFKDHSQNKVAHNYDAPKIFADVKRNFLPGSQWLYYKFYCSSTSANEFLTKYIYNLVEKHNDLIKKWFFIRYSDPGSHLRIRFLCTANNIGTLNDIINKVAKEAFDIGSINDITINCYNREVERYGVNCIDINESIFNINSNLIKPIVEMQTADKVNEEFVFLSGCYLFHITLEQSQFSVEEKIGLSKDMYQAFFTEFKIDKDLKLSIDKKYRKLAKRISSVMMKEKEFLNQELINEQGLLIDRLRQKISDQAYFKNISASILHMTANRLFHDFQRYQEGLIYYFLFKQYSSIYAKEKYSGAGVN